MKTSNQDIKKIVYYDINKRHPKLGNISANGIHCVWNLSIS